MADFRFDKNVLLDKTNGGLDVFLRLFPDCMRNGKLVHFKTHNEDTASTMIKKMNDGIYILTNFGGDGKGKNCFDVLMEKEGLNFVESCRWIASEFSINGEKIQLNKPEIEFKAATSSQKEGDYYYTYHDNISNEHLKVLGPLITNHICRKYHVKSCAEFIQVKETKIKDSNQKQLTQIKTSSTEKYPIFVIDLGDWQKIYQPLNHDKKYRFRYVGDKPKDYLFGLDNLKKEFNNFTPQEEEEDKRLPYVFIGAGDRDSLNIASLGYPVVWKNSETAILSYSEYRSLIEYAKEVIYIGDLDETGIRQTIKLALSNIDIKISWLPNWIKEHKYRGKSRKDFTDWINLVYDPLNIEKLHYQFKGLINDAAPSRFWDAIYENNKFKKYTLSNERLYRFLTYNGFYVYKELEDRPEFDYIQVNNGIVKKVFFQDLNRFPANYIKEKRKPIPLVDFIHRSAQLSEKSLAKLSNKKINFKDCGVDHQLLFFKNRIWKITSEEIKECKYGDIDAYVWQNKIIDHNVKINKERTFKISLIKNELGQDKYDIEIIKRDNHFLNYLINTSRVHWRKCGDKPFNQRIKQIKETNPLKRNQLIDQINNERISYRTANQFNIEEKGLTKEEVQEQKEHLINKIFAMGYLMHKQKRGDKGWLVFAMDNRISEISESNGGSGKSIFLDKAIRKVLLSNKTVAGRDKEIIKSQFLYEGISETIDYVLFDDADAYFPIQRLFTDVTGDLNVNWKYKGSFNIPYEKSPKFAISSNFGLFKPDSSTERRVLYTVFSDYYHYKSDLDSTEWNVKKDIGKELFTDFDEKEWSDFFNVCAESIQFHLSTDEKIEPPKGNIQKRNSLQTMGDAFKEWADMYFYNRLDEQIIKNISHTDFEQKTKLKKSSQNFKKCLKEWCRFHNYELNPSEVLNNQGYNKHNHQGTATEFIYLKSKTNNEVNFSPKDQLSDEFDPIGDDVKY